MTKIKKILSFPFRHKKLILFLLVVVGLIIFVLSPKQTAVIETEKIKRQDIVQSVSASGKIESETSVKLTFLIPGKLVAVNAKKGDPVQKGQVIAVLDQRSVQKNLENELRSYSLQRNTFDQTLDDNQDRTPEQALNDTMKRILQSNQYSLDQAVISVELQALANEQSVLVTPISGIVTQADVAVPGVNITTTTTYAIADPDHIVFKIDVDEADIGKVKPGIPVKINLEAFPDKTVDLTVTKIDFTSHESDNGANVYTVEAMFPDNSEQNYRIGMNGDAEIILSEKAEVLTVPIGSIVDDKYVYIKKDDKYEKRKVSFGVQSDIDREVTSGITEGEEVVLIPDEVATLQKNEKKFFFF